MKKRKNKKVLKNKIDSWAKAFLVWLRKNHDRFLLCFVVVIIANVSFMTFVRGHDSIAELFSVSKGLLENKIRNENIDHFVFTRKIVKGVIVRIDTIEDELGWPNDDVWLTGQERLDLIDQLQRLDELSYELEWAANEYFSDYSIQYYPYSTGNLSHYIYETRHLKKAIDRFVRVSETSILIDSFNRRQVQVIDSELREIRAYLENLEKFEGNLILLNGDCSGKHNHDELDSD